LLGYKAAFIALCLVSLATLLQNGLTALLAFVHEEQIPGVPLRFDHSKLSFRALRTFDNSAESLSAFGCILMLGIIAGASSAWVGGLAVAFLAGRLAFWAIYYSGIGKTAGGPRTMTFIVGLLSNTILAVLTLLALLRV